MLSLLMTIFLLGFATPNRVYEPLLGVVFEESLVWYSENLNVNTTYVFMGQDDKLSEKEIERVSYKSEAAIQHYAGAKGYPVEECREIKTLEIYYVSEEVLNDSKRFPTFINENLGPNDIVWGAYDPVHKHKDYAVLIISNPGGNKTEETQAHELFHYWYDRFCWERVASGSPEEAALEFETFYEKNYM